MTYLKLEELIEKVSSKLKNLKSNVNILSYELVGMYSSENKKNIFYGKIFLDKDKKSKEFTGEITSESNKYLVDGKISLEKELIKIEFIKIPSEKNINYNPPLYFKLIRLNDGTLEGCYIGGTSTKEEILLECNLERGEVILPDEVKKAVIFLF